MSDREFKMISDSATSLNRSMSEDAFKAELGRIKEGLTSIRERAGAAGADAGAGAGAGPAVGTTRMINGQRAQWDGKGWLPAK